MAKRRKSSQITTHYTDRIDTTMCFITYTAMIRPKVSA